MHDEERNVEAPKMSFPEVLDQLLTGERVSIALLFRLSDLAPTDMALLLARWAETTDERRHEVARHMADLSENNFQIDFAPLFEHFLHDELADVRLAALDGLWDSDSLTTIPKLLEMAQKDKVMAVRVGATATLGHYVLMSEWGQLPFEVSDQIVDTLLPLWEQASDVVAWQCAILETISSANKPQIPMMIENAYSSADESLQISALFAMGNSADERWLPIVLDEIESYQSEVRFEAVRAAGKIGDESAVPALAEVLWDEDLEVQLAAVYSLGQIGGAEAQRLLMMLMDDPEAESLHDAVEDALEEINWAGELNFDMLDWGGEWDEDEDELVED
ncbi:MAG TPA: HEAT repeat domain-containing protein [Anaerolineae bacterium]|nr:HEAT repeat domain-containing protein [Anaerolineae bacterium]